MQVREKWLSSYILRKSVDETVRENSNDSVRNKLNYYYYCDYCGRSPSCVCFS